MSSLSERLTRGSASPSQVDHARRLVADWQLLADLSFADLVLWLPLRPGATGAPGFVAVAQMRPTTGPTATCGTLHRPRTGMPRRTWRARSSTTT